MTTVDPQLERRVEQCQGLVRSLATQIGRKLPPYVELEDLIEYGQLGLVEAAGDFDPQRGGQFSTYAYYRIRGAIYDGLAKMSWFSRAQYRRIRYEQMADDVVGSAYAGEGEPADDVGSAAASVEMEARRFRDVSRSLSIVYLATHRSAGREETTEASELVDASSPEPSAAAIGRELSLKLLEVIEALPLQEATFICDVYYQGMTLQDAGQRLGISRAWASRLHARILRRLARSLRLLEATP
jgi:RNA polymerase sigma factor for flagellar operon FliA